MLPIVLGQAIDQAACLLPGHLPCREAMLLEQAALLVAGQLLLGPLDQRPHQGVRPVKGKILDFVPLDAEYYVTIEQDLLTFYGPKNTFKQLYEINVRPVYPYRGLGMKFCRDNFDQMILFKAQYFDGRAEAYGEDRFIDDPI